MKPTLSKKVQEVLASGSAKQKAAILCASSNNERKMGKPLLTDAEVKAIYDSLRKGEAKEAKEFNKWLQINEIIIEFGAFLTMSTNIYLSYANELMEYIRVWEAYEREADHINALIDFTEENSPETLDAFREKISRLSWTYGKAKINSDGYLEIDIDGVNGLYSIIQDKREIVIEALSQMKAIVFAFKEWIAKKKAQPFVAEPIKEELHRAIQDVAARIAPYHSEHTLNKLRARGEAISPADEKRAVFPDYDTTPMSEQAYEAAQNRLEYLIANEK